MQFIIIPHILKNSIKYHNSLYWIGIQGPFSFLYFIKSKNLTFFITKKFYYFIYSKNYAKYMKRLVNKSSIYIFTFSNKKILINFLSNLKKYRPVEPYKGKGLRFVNELVLRKEGKRSNL